MEIEELSGDKYPNLKAAQRLAMPAIVSSLDSVFHDLLERGILVIQNAYMIPSALLSRPAMIHGPYHVISENNYYISENA